MKIGILSLQGDYEAHSKILSLLGAEPVFVRRAADLEGLDGLILPGGESTTMLRLLDAEELTAPLVEFAQNRPLYGTCAGAILMASEVVSPAQPSLGLLPIKVQRNAYGRQVESFITQVEPEPPFAARTRPGPLEAVFIRAPRILETGAGVETLLRLGGDPILVEQGRHLAGTFHAELTADPRIHQLFLEKVRSCSQAGA